MIGMAQILTLGNRSLASPSDDSIVAALDALTIRAPGHPVTFADVDRLIEEGTGRSLVRRPASDAANDNDSLGAA